MDRCSVSEAIVRRVDQVDAPRLEPIVGFVDEPNPMARESSVDRATVAASIKHPAPAHRDAHLKRSDRDCPRARPHPAHGDRAPLRRRAPPAIEPTRTRLIALWSWDGSARPGAGRVAR
jgi:hypothetical protein